MIAVIKTGGKQYIVEKGATLRVEKLTKKEGSDITFKEVFLLADGKSVQLGTPIVKGAKVVAKIIETAKSDKVIVYKYKKRKRYSKKFGHRQPYTQLEIVEISGSASSTKLSEKKVVAPAKK